MFHDEFGYLAVGRLLGPGPAPELFGPLYHPGYGILLAPADYFISSGALLHQLTQTLNAAFAGALVPVLYLVGRRVARIEPTTALILATAGATSASVLASAQMLIPETLLGLITASSVLMVHRWLAAPTKLLHAVAAGSTIGFAYLVHPRSLALALALALCGAAAAVARIIPIRSLALCLMSFAAFALATRQINQWVLESLYPFATTTTGSGQRLDLLITEPQAAAKSMIGTLWGLTASTLGLAPLGIVAATLRLRTKQPAAERVAAAYLVVGLAASLAMSAVFLAGSLVNPPSRPDLTVYGRYADQWVPVAIVYAAALRRRHIAVAGGGVLALLLAGLILLRTRYSPDIWTRPAALHNIAGLSGPRHFTGSLDLARDGWWFVVGAAGATALAAVRNIRWMAAA